MKAVWNKIIRYSGLICAGGECQSGNGMDVWLCRKGHEKQGSLLLLLLCLHKCIECYISRDERGFWLKVSLFLSSGIQLGYCSLKDNCLPKEVYCTFDSNVCLYPLHTNSHCKEYLTEGFWKRINKSVSDTKLGAGWVPFYVFRIIQDQFHGKNSGCVTHLGRGRGTWDWSTGMSQQVTFHGTFTEDAILSKVWKPGTMKSGRNALGKAQWRTNLSPNSVLCVNISSLG